VRLGKDVSFRASRKSKDNQKGKEVRLGAQPVHLSTRKRKRPQSRAPKSRKI